MVLIVWDYLLTLDAEVSYFKFGQLWSEYTDEKYYVGRIFLGLLRPLFGGIVNLFIIAGLVGWMDLDQGVFFGGTLCPAVSLGTISHWLELEPVLGDINYNN